MSSDELGVDDEIVGQTQDEDIVSDLIVSPANAHVTLEKDVFLPVYL
jgi:hypothetical protein